MSTPTSSDPKDVTEQAGTEESVEAIPPPTTHQDDSHSVIHSTDEQPGDVEPTPWLRRGDQIFVGVLVVIAFGLMAAHWARLSGWGMQPVEIERLPEREFDFQLEINSATWVEWLQLEGIGDTLAHRIVEDRETKGPFAGIDDLARVKGIGPKTVEKIRPWLRVESVEQH